MQYDPRPDLLFLKEKVDNLEIRLNKIIEIVIRLEEIIYEQFGKKDSKKCRS